MVVITTIGREIFSFMDGFCSYNQIQMRPNDAEMMIFIIPWGTFVTAMSFGLKNA